MEQAKKEYKLTKVWDEEFGYEDQDGVHHRSPAEWLWSILGGCGCGSSEDFANKSVQLLKHFGTEHPKRKLSSVDVYNDETMELLAHWFDSKGLTEHGTGIGSSWLSEKGQQILKAIESPLKQDN